MDAQSEAASQRTDVPTTMQQSEAACQWTDVPTTMQQSAAAYQRTDVPTTMQQSAAAYQRTDVPTTMQQSEAACQWTDVPATMQQEAQVPAPSAATDLSQRTGAIGNSGTISGSHNPIIVNSSGVNINYNFPLEGPGVPAPRPQHSQRPDQEPRLGAPSYQDVGNKTRDILKEFYRTTGSYVQLLPGVDNDQMHIAGIYTKVQLETREGVAVVTSGETVRKRGQKGENVNSTEYNKIFRVKTRTGELIKRLIFVGMGGVGKSTIFDKIAYDWADETSEILNEFKLVFRLKMCALSQESDLVDAFDQLLDEDSGIAKEELEKFILANPNEVLILLDGFDEMTTEKLNAASFGSILKALNRTKYRKSSICVSTRPSHLETLMSRSLVQNPCIHVQVLGFTDEDVHEYIQKFYAEDSDSGNALIQTIGKSSVPHDLAKNPMLLLLMCLLWRENNKLPETTSRLFTKAVDYMFTRKDEDKKTASDAKKRKLDVPKEVNAIGKTALRGLLFADQKFSFQEDEFDPIALLLALKAGILNRQSVIKNLKSHNSIQFMHKTMQEYCAAKYLQSLESGKFQRILSQLCSTMEDLVSNDFLLRFCCGDSEECMTRIVNLLDYCKISERNTGDKSMYKHKTNTIQAITLNCFFESQSDKVPAGINSYSLVPSNIEVDNDDFRSLMYLLEIIYRSDSRTAHLSRIEMVTVWDMPLISDLAPALGHMENLRELRLCDCPFVKGDLEKTLRSLKHNPNLTSLKIDSCDTLGGRAIAWAPHIKHLAILEELEISDCKLLGTDIEHIALAAHDIPGLNDLNFSSNNTLGGSAELWANELPKLMHLFRLDLSDCDWTPTDIEHIATAVCDMPRLTDLILARNVTLGGSAELWADELAKLTHLNWLKLSDCHLIPTDIEHIASAVGDMPRLTDLILNSNWLLGGGADLWADDLSKMAHLKRLDLSDCDLMPSEIKHIAMAVGDMPRLTDLSLSFHSSLCGSANSWAKELPKCTHVKKLDLTCCDLTPPDIEHIALAVRDMPRLTDLILNGNKALGGSAELWAKEMPKMTHLKRLDLSDCKLKGTDIKHIASAVGDMPRLTDLTLNGNKALGKLIG